MYLIPFFSLKSSIVFHKDNDNMLTTIQCNLLIDVLFVAHATLIMKGKTKETENEREKYFTISDLFKLNTRVIC